MLSDPCPDCAFDGARYTATDLAGTLRSFDLWLGWAVEGRAGAVPEAIALHDRARELLDGSVGLDDVDRAHLGIHHLWAIGRAVAAAGAGPAPAAGRVVQVNASGGGVPKRALEEAEVELGGVVGDRQAARKHHGRPWQALCLWSSEVIDALRGEGHPIAFGSAGENITVGGIDWPSMGPGVRLRIGQVLAETTAWAVPCKKNAAWFVGGNFDRMHHDRHPGWSRIYASVLEPGRVAPGDAVVVEP